MTVNRPISPPAGYPPVQEIAEDIYRIWMPLSGSPMTDLDHLNTYLIKGTQGWLLIDCGWNAPDACQALEAALDKLSLGITDIQTLVLTHSHPDHCGMTGKIKSISPKTQILMHHWEAVVVELRYKDLGAFHKLSTALLEKHGVPPEEVTITEGDDRSLREIVNVAPPDKILFGGEIIQTGIYDLEVIWSPGHSPGLVCLYEPRNQILFSGDHILPGITPNVGYNNQSGGNPLDEYIHSLENYRKLPISVIHPGHESSFINVNERIDSLIAHHKQRENEISKALGGGVSNAYEVASKLTWNVRGLTWKQYNPIHKSLATSEVIAHLEHMRWNGEIKRVMREGHFYYSAV